MSFKTQQISLLLAAITAVIPALAQTDVSRYGATGNGSTDDTAALQQAINSTPTGATLTFGGPSQVYLISSRLVFQPGRTYSGQGTIRMKSSATPHTAVAKLSYGASSQVAIIGITFDANGVGGGLQMAVDGAAAIPANSVTINHVVFRNTTSSPAGPWDAAIYDPVGLTNSQITSNQVINCGMGMYFTNLNSVTISGNTFQGVDYGDAISVTFSPATFLYGQGIQILQNTGQHLGRMGVELWPSGGNVAQTSAVEGVTISGNTFSGWNSGYAASDTFGISVMAGTANVIQNNKLSGPNAGYGIELGTPQSLVSQNTVQGFATGIALEDSFNSTITGNLLSQQITDGVEFTNAPGSASGVTVTNNSIMNAQTYGIFANTSAWGGSNITGNMISRAAGFYAADNTQSFTGIATTPPATPVTVSSNLVIQSSATGPSEFGFIGIRLNGGTAANALSTYQQNTVLSYLMLNQSVGIFGNSAGSADSVYLTQNAFNGLFSVTGGAPSSNAIISGNQMYNCAQVGPIQLVP
jgi:nitrous oxidase accessory protein NosD